MADTKDCVYFAGFFDGEGSIGIYRRKYIVCLSNTDLRPLTMAKGIWGGSVFSQRQGQQTVQQIWRWHLYGRNALPFLDDIRPFVVIKGEQIDLFVSAVTVMPNGRGERRTANATSVIDYAAGRLKMLKRGIA